MPSASTSQSPDSADLPLSLYLPKPPDKWPKVGSRPKGCNALGHVLALNPSLFKSERADEHCALQSAVGGPVINFMKSEYLPAEYSNVFSLGEWTAAHSQMLQLGQANTMSKVQNVNVPKTDGVQKMYQLLLRWYSVISANVRYVTATQPIVSWNLFLPTDRNRNVRAGGGRAKASPDLA